MTTWLESSNTHQDGTPVTRKIKIPEMGEEIWWTDNAYAEVSDDVADILANNINTISKLASAPSSPGTYYGDANSNTTVQINIADGVFDALSAESIASDVVSTEKGPNEVIHAANYSSVQEAIADAPAGGALITLPPGETVIQNPPLVINKLGITLGGHGYATKGQNGASWLSNPATDGTNAVEITMPNVQLRDLVIAGNSSSGHGVYLDGNNNNPYNHCFTRVAARNHGGDGFHNLTAWHGHMSYTRSYNNAGNGVYIGQNPTGMVLNHCWANNCGKAGFHIDGRGSFSLAAMDCDGPGILTDGLRGSDAYFYAEGNGGGMTNPVNVDLEPRGTNDTNTGGAATRGCDITIWTSNTDDGHTSNNSYGVRASYVENIKLSGEIASGDYGFRPRSSSFGGIELEDVSFDDSRLGTGRILIHVGVIEAEAISGGRWRASTFGGVKEALNQMARVSGSPGTVIVDGQFTESVDVRDDATVPAGVVIEGISPHQSLIDGSDQGAALFTSEGDITVRDLGIKNTNGAGHGEDAIATTGSNHLYENIKVFESDNHGLRESGTDVVVKDFDADAANISARPCMSRGTGAQIVRSSATVAVDSTTTGASIINPAEVVNSQSGTRVTVDGLGYNSGDPSAGGDWNGNGREGVTVRDTTNGITYLYNDGTWSQIA